MARPVGGLVTGQRVILPATSQVSLRPSITTTGLQQIRPLRTTGAPTLTQLPPGTTIIAGNQNMGPGVQQFALVPAQYVQVSLFDP